MPEILGDAAEYFDPMNVADATRAIKKVVYTPGLINELVKKGRERINIYSWSRCAKETLDVYHKLVKK